MLHLFFSLCAKHELFIFLGTGNLKAYSAVISKLRELHLSFNLFGMQNVWSTSHFETDIFSDHCDMRDASLVLYLYVFVHVGVYESTCN